MRDGWLSVSEVISFADKPFLLNWARKLALQGLDHNRVSTLGKYAGRIMHYEFQKRYGAPPLDPMESVVGPEMPRDVVEAYSDPEAVEHGGTAWAKLDEWAVHNHIDERGAQIEVPLEDEELKVRARMDCLVDNLKLYDWKSSKHIYAESLLEIGAYDYLWTRKHPTEPFLGWGIVQCSHEDDSPAIEYTFEESDIKQAGMTFALMVPAVRAFREFEALAKDMLKGGT